MAHASIGFGLPGSAAMTEHADGWWLRRYRRSDLPADLVAGTVVAIMLVPQSMAYALLAGLPVQVGLYASMLPVAIYALLGTSRSLAVGPVAIVSLLVATGLAPLAAPGTPEYLGLALTLAAMVGLLQLGLGLARAGFLVNFLSHAVVSGFTSAAALVIAASQLRHLIAFPGADNASSTAGPGWFSGVDDPTLAIGAGALLVVLLSRRGIGTVARRFGMSDAWRVPLERSGPLIAIALGIAAVVGLDLDSVAVVGEIPRELPRPSWPTLDLSALQALLPVALAITFVGFIESYAVAIALAARQRETVEANRELVALGLANWGSALSGGYPVTGGLSRSMVNAAAGATSGMASLVTAGLVAFTLAFLTPLLFHLPKAVLAAIIVAAVAGLVDIAALPRLWRYSRADGLAWIGTFSVVLAVGVERGILTGAVIAVGLHLWHTSRPHLAIVGRVGTSEHFRNIERHQVQTWPDLLIVRIDESLYFANAAFLESKLLAMVAARPGVRHLVLIASAVNFIDGSALETLDRLRAELVEAGATLHLAEVKGPVMDRLEGTRFLDRLAPGRVFLSAHKAVTFLADENPPQDPAPPSSLETTSNLQPENSRLRPQ